MFRGSIVALITPFRNRALDERAFQDHILWQIEQGTSGLVPVGTTGESPAVSHDEHKRLVELCIEAAAGQVPVIAGTGSNSTAEAIDLTAHAKAAGADAALVVTPYYNKPTQEGLYAHFKAIADAVDIPILIYNIPPRSVIDMSPETMARLAKLPNVVGVKDATMDLTRPLTTTELCGEEFCQLSGEDGTALAFDASGGAGCISVTANVAPKLCAAMHAAFFAGKGDEALAIQRRLMPLHRALFYESSPVPVKYALHRLRGTSPEVRLPLVELRPESRARVEAALEAAGINA